jgi:hypothetical protein
MKKSYLKIEKNLKTNQSTEIRNSLKIISIEKLNENVLQSEKDFENGRFKTTSELLKKY